jgi:hypothetical protein
MKEYRIVKETESYTKSVYYCIQQKKKKFLRREFWATYYYYDTYEQAKCMLGKLTQEIIREVVE